MAEVTGPIMHADAAVEIMLDGISRSIAHELQTRWLVNLDGSIRVNRHVYTSHVVAQRDPDGWRVTDGGVVYGPWLLARRYGITKRNHKVQRVRIAAPCHTRYGCAGTRHSGAECG